MRKFRPAKRGQFFTLGSLIISLIVLSVAVVAHNNLSNVQRFRTQNYDQMIMGVREDFRRALANALSIVSELYILDGNQSRAGEAGTYLRGWQRCMVETFPGAGLKTEVSFNETILQPRKYLSFLRDQSPISYTLEAWNLTDGEAAHCFWYKPQGLSAASAGLRLELGAEGLMGWEDKAQILLNVTISETLTDSQINTTSCVIEVYRETMGPVLDLTAASFSVSIYDKSQGSWILIPNDDLTLDYWGLGCYNIVFKPSLENRELLITVEDSRSISVRVYTSDTYP